MTDRFAFLDLVIPEISQSYYYAQAALPSRAYYVCPYDGDGDGSNKNSGRVDDDENDHDHSLPAAALLTRRPSLSDLRIRTDARADAPPCDPPSAAPLSLSLPPSPAFLSPDMDCPSDSTPVFYPSPLDVDLDASAAAAPWLLSPASSDDAVSDLGSSPPLTPVDPDAADPFSDQFFRIRSPFLDDDDDSDDEYSPLAGLAKHSVARGDAAPPALLTTAWFTELCMREAYLFPSCVLPAVSVCVYDPAWHEDACATLPRICVVGAEDTDRGVHGGGDDDDDDVCWDHLMVPCKTNTGRLSADDEAFYGVVEPEPETECLIGCAEPLADAVFDGGCLSVDSDGGHVFTFVPQRVPGQRWLWKNF